MDQSERRVIERQTFVSRVAHGGVYEHLELRRCTFDACGISAGYDVANRPVLRDIWAQRLKVRRAVVDSPIIEDCVIDGLTTPDPLFVKQPALRHVVLRGRSGAMMVTPEPDTGERAERAKPAFVAANRAFYDSVDWALDITEADPDQLDLRVVPGHLVRRDPERTALVTREAALRGAWRTLDLRGTYWRVVLDRYAKWGGYESIVLVASIRDRKYPRLVDGLKLLKDAGVAEPDG